MCGIAGYSISNEWAGKYINEAKVEKMLKEAWFHNIHRGHQAAGFFGTTTDGKLTVYKSPGRADKIFETDIEGKGVLDPYKLMGAHTREPSAGAGDPKDNVNNHPVSYGGCVAIHNGTIYNDVDIVNELKLNKKQLKALGDVDSVAIPIVLSGISHPEENPKEVADALSRLRGGFAVHATWEEYPGVSVLVRGNTSPLVIAQHKSSHGLFYGSEKESVWHMISKMGLDPNKGWDFRTMDQGTMIILIDGYPVEWGTFKPLAKTGTTHEPTYMARYLPNDTGRELVYMTDHSSDFAQKEKKNLSMRDSKKEPLYRREEHPKMYPVEKGELDIAGVLSEADYCIRNNGFIHAFYGNVEIIMSEGSRIVKDVYNHDLFSMEQRWVELDKITEPITSSFANNDLTWKDFYLKKSTILGILPQKEVPYRYLREVTTSSDSGKGQITIGELMKAGQNSGTPDDETTDPDLFRNIGARRKPPYRLGWANRGESTKKITEVVVPHKDIATLAFVGDFDVTCSTHKEKLSQHDMPYDCKGVLMAASFTISMFEDLNMWWYFSSPAEEESYTFKHMTYTPGYSVNAACMKDKETPCQYIESEVVRIYATRQYWEVVVTEDCWNCGATRSIKLPDWFDKIDCSRTIVNPSYC